VQNQDHAKGEHEADVAALAKATLAISISSSSAQMTHGVSTLKTVISDVAPLTIATSTRDIVPASQQEKNKILAHLDSFNIYTQILAFLPVRDLIRELILHEKQISGNFGWALLKERANEVATYILEQLFQHWDSEEVLPEIPHILKAVLSEIRKYVTSIDFTHVPITHEILGMLLRLFPNLQTIEFPGLGQYLITPAMLRDIATLCPKMRKLVLREDCLACNIVYEPFALEYEYSRSATREAFEDLVKNCRDIETLALISQDPLKGIDHEHLLGQAIVKNCAKLRKLILRGKNQISDEQWQDIVKNNPDMETLVLHVGEPPPMPFYRVLSDVAARAIGKQWHGMKTLALLWDYTRAALESIVNNCHEIETLALGTPRENSRNDISQTLHAIATNCTKLKRVNLFLYPHNSDDIEDLVQHCLDIEELSLGKEPLTDATVHAIAFNCPKLRAIQFNDTNCSAAAFEYLVTHCHDIEELSITGKNLTPDSFHTLASKCSKLRRLNVCSSREFTDDVVVDIVKNCHDIEELNIDFTLTVAQAIATYCPKLRRLTFFGKDPSSDVFNIIIKNCHNLEELVGRGKHLTEDSFQAIAANCPKLRVFVALNCPGLTDSQLENITKNCRNIEVLLLDSKVLTKASLKSVETNCNKLLIFMFQYGTALSCGPLWDRFWGKPHHFHQCPNLHELILANFGSKDKPIMLHQLLDSLY
jgi:hypothetical protein